MNFIEVELEKVKKQLDDLTKRLEELENRPSAAAADPDKLVEDINRRLVFCNI